MIGIIFDTHGLVCPQVMTALTAAELIVHAGDIGTPDVRGNYDQDLWAKQIPPTTVVEHQSYV
ncbi:MAG: hypothetical protein NPIRA03_02310 [Nitrospirales bacterium]|nr:MAG: hypothetical protein NPIRA03_02310 [Nitrospirales bacterium]